MMMRKMTMIKKNKTNYQSTKTPQKSSKNTKQLSTDNGITDKYQEENESKEMANK